MIGGSCVRLFVAALALSVPATMAGAVTPSTQAMAGGNIIHPLTVTKIKDMDFGYLAAPTAGTAVLDPDTDGFSVTGGTLPVGGTETMTVSKFTLQGLSRRALAKADSFTFRVGATLTVPANQVEGTYVGTFAVTVQYP